MPVVEQVKCIWYAQQKFIVSGCDRLMTNFFTEPKKDYCYSYPKSSRTACKSSLRSTGLANIRCAPNFLAISK